MREILEDAFLIYREEMENLFALLVPAVIIGPVGLMIAASGLRLALAMVPFLLLLYLGTASACLHWAGYQANHRRSSAGTLRALLRGAPNIILSSAPVVVVLAAATVCGLLVADQGFDYLAWLAAAAGAAVGTHWLTRHAYELPLVVAFDASARQARDASSQLDYRARHWTLRLLSAIAAPMCLAALLGVWLAMVVHPIVGATVFLLAGTLWLPFASLCLVGACERLLQEAAPSHQRPARVGAEAATPARR